MSAETWLPVPNSGGKYEVSDLGRVRKKARWTDGLHIYEHRLLSLDLTRDGYFRVELVIGGKSIKRSVHRLVLEAFIGLPVGDRDQVNHKSGIRDDNRLQNLEYTTASENMLHRCRVLESHREKGSRHGQHKLIEADVEQIIARSSKGEPLAAIASDFGVSVPTVSMIARGRTWRHIPRAQQPDRRY